MSNHSFDTHVATEYKSTDIAILVWHFKYWITINKRLGKNFIEERTWTYQTMQEIAAPFPFWSIYQVERLLKKAIDLKILIKSNFNKSQFDRTVWYAFENEEKFGISRFREMDDAESRNEDREIANSYKDRYTLPDTSTDIDDQKREKNDDDEKEGKAKSPEKVIKERANGEKVECSKKEYYRYLSINKLQWTAQEVEEAWERFCNGNAKIGDYRKYLDQIIKNMREQTCANTQKTKEKSEKNDWKQKEENIYASTSDPVIRRPPSPKFTSPLL